MRLLSIRLLLIALMTFTTACYASYMEVTLLGTGTPRPSIERFGSATVVEVKGRYFLFDAGRGVTIRLQQAGIPLNRVEHVFLTHLHSDHISGLSDLWLTSWIWQRPNAIRVTGPTGTKQLTTHLEQAYQADYQYRSNNTGLTQSAFDLEHNEISEDTIVYQQDGITITAFLVDHRPVKPAFGYKIESGDRTIVISGDTTYSTNLIDYATGVDLLVHEIAASSPQLLERNPRLQRVMSYHTTPEQIATVLDKTKPSATVFNHVLLFGVSEDAVIEKIKQRYEGNLRMGQDLMKIGVGETIRFY